MGLKKRDKVVDCLMNSFLDGNKFCDYGLREEFRGQEGPVFYEVVSERYSNLAKLFAQKLGGEKVGGRRIIAWHSFQDLRSDEEAYVSVDLDYYVERFRNSGFA